MRSFTRRSRRRPSRPPGWERAKSSAPKSRASRSAIAIASPIASAAVVLAVGARAERACLLRDADVDVHVRVARETRRRVAGKGDERHPDPLDVGDDGQDLGRLAGVRERDDRVLARDHAEIAVARLAGMNEERGSSGARHRRRHLVSHVPRFPHSGHDHAARSFEDDLAGAGEVVVDSGQEPAECVDLRADHFGSEPEEGALAHLAGGDPGGGRRALLERIDRGRAMAIRAGRSRMTVAGREHR